MLRKSVILTFFYPSFLRDHAHVKYINQYKLTAYLCVWLLIFIPLLIP